jgi:hypothetical protein
VLQHEHDPAMEELRRELAAARRANANLNDHIQWIEYRHDSYIEALTEDNVELERQLAQARADSLSDWWAMGSDVEPRRLLTWREYLEQEVAYRQRREAHLADGANRLVRWAAQGGSEEDVPDEMWRAIQVMRGDEVESDDAEMAVDSAAVP